MLDDRPYMRNPSRSAPWSTSVILIIIIGGVYFLQLVTRLASGTGPNPFERYLALNPSDPFYAWFWQLITFQFLHANTFHLLLNCLMIYFVGRPVEDALGREGFLKLYFSCGVCGGILQIPFSLMVIPEGWDHAPAVVGASAGLFGLFGGLSALYWERHLTFLLWFVFPITIRGKFIAYGLGVLTIFGLLETRSGIAHAAHLGGLLAGVAFIKYGIAHRIQFDWSGLGSMFKKSGPPRPTPIRPVRTKTALPTEEELASPDFISREVDPILEKISAHGIHSLNERERQILEKARARMSRR